MVEKNFTHLVAQNSNDSIREQFRSEAYHFERIITQNTTDLVCIHGVDKSIVYCTDSVSVMLGYNVDEICGRDLFDFMSDDFRREMNEALLSRMIYREGTEVKVMLRKRSGDNIWVKTSWFDGRNIKGLPDELSLSITSDVTESVLLMEDLIHAWSKEKEVNELRANIFSIASHEFKTPLAILQMQLDILCEWKEEDELNARYNKVFDKFQEQIERLNRMITDILQFRKMSSGKEPFNPQEIEVLKIVKQEIYQLKDKYPNREINLDVVGKIRLQQADERMLRYIASNLLDNALKYSTAENSVLVELKFKNNILELRVKDSGIGIPSEEIHRVFKPFYRAGNAVTKEGTGIALAVIKEFVVFHHGDIQVKSEEGEGSEFLVKLPYQIFSRI
jgi:PAS domain S-box-containing protein